MGNKRWVKVLQYLKVLQLLQQKCCSGHYGEIFIAITLGADQINLKNEASR